MKNEQEKFDLYDLNADGFIDMEEFRTELNKYDLDEDTYNIVLNIGKYFAGYNAKINKNKFNQFIKLMIQGPQSIEDEALLTFIFVDTNSDAQMSRHEANKFMKQILQLPKQQRESILKVLTDKYIERFRYGPNRGEWTQISIEHFTKF